MTAVRETREGELPGMTLGLEFVKGGQRAERDDEKCAGPQIFRLIFLFCPQETFAHCS